MTTQSFIFGLIGGLGLFFIGMRFMSEGLQRAAGHGLRRILEGLTSNRWMAALVGLFMTAVIQSSSATSVMAVGFVNAGLMHLEQAIGVVIGANVGTTATAQIIAFQVQQYGLPAIGLGVGLRLFATNSRWRSLGEVVMGFGMLFYGLALMKETMAPLRESAVMREVFIELDGNPLLGVLAGTLFTVLVQSSSVTVGIVMTLAASGLLSFPGSVAIMLGDNIGTTITAQLACIGTNPAARRVAQAHTIFNLAGVCYVLALFPLFIALVNRVSHGDADLVIATLGEAKRFGMALGDKPYIARHIANAHTLFNVVNALLFLPLMGLLARLTRAIIPQRGIEEEYHLVYLDTRFAETPAIAIKEARSETVRMGETALAMLEGVMQAFVGNTERGLDAVRKREDVVDHLQREIVGFLVRTSQSTLSPQDSARINSIIHMVNNLERIGDHSENLCGLAARKIRSKLVIPQDTAEGLEALYAVTHAFLEMLIREIPKGTHNIMARAIVYEDQINQTEDALRERAVAGLNDGTLKIDPGLLFMEILTNMERIGDHCFNIAEAVSGRK